MEPTKISAIVVREFGGQYPTWAEPVE